MSSDTAPLCVCDCVPAAATARTTVKSIMRNNPWLHDAAEVRPGMAVCLLLCSAAAA